MYSKSSQTIAHREQDPICRKYSALREAVKLDHVVVGRYSSALNTKIITPEFHHLILLNPGNDVLRARKNYPLSSQFHQNYFKSSQSKTKPRTLKLKELRKYWANNSGVYVTENPDTVIIHVAHLMTS